MVDLIAWSDGYSIGIDEIDKQHKKFFEVVHEFYMNILNCEGEKAVEETLEFLKSYAAEHFQSEEASMKKYEYPRIEEHKKLHEEFIENFDTLADRFNTFGPSQGLADEALDMTQNWLTDHISDVDAQYAEHVPQSSE
jgi:hemerythrin